MTSFIEDLKTIETILSQKSSDPWVVDPFISHLLLKVSLQNKRKINQIDIFPAEYDYEFNEYGMKCIKSIVEDEEYKNNTNDTSKKYLEVLKLIKAREEDFEFEMKIAEVICGDNLKFPYKKGWELTNFFKELGFNYEHDSSTRKRWVCYVLKSSNSCQIHKFLTEGVFKRRYFIENGKDIEEAKMELKNIIDSSCKANELIDISESFGLNISNEILFNEEISTDDKTFNELVKESKDLFVKGNKQLAIEKIWDAFERIKTIDGIKKTEIVTEMSKNGLDLENEEIEKEFKTLTSIGNTYQIRHFETSKKPITNDEERCYLYFRVLALINLVLMKIKRLSND